jgi:glycosyltransferase involved in cell wall biosynthesis
MDKSNYKHHRNPEVSIILPTYNRGNLLERALESIRYQAFKDFEVVLINDGGSDISPIIKKFPDLKITYIQHEKNLGLSEARNSGLKIAKGKYITYLDDDDEYYPNHLESLINYLDRSPDVKVAYSIAMYKYQQKSIKGRQKSNKITARFFKFDEQQILINNLSPITCFCHLKECVKVVGGFNPSLKRYEDWEFWIRLSRVYKFKQIQEVTCQINKWRIHDGKHC